MALIEKQITNHPALGLKRVLGMCGIFINDDEKAIQFFQRTKALNQEDNEIQGLNLKYRDWKKTNATKIKVLDENQNPVLNPDYVPEYEVVGQTEKPIDWDEELQGEFVPEEIYGETIVNPDDEFVWIGEYDYTIGRLLPLIEGFLEEIISEDDAKGQFDS